MRNERGNEDDETEKRRNEESKGKLGKASENGKFWENFLFFGTVESFTRPKILLFYS